MLLLLSGVYLSCQGYTPLPPGQEGKEGWRKAGHTYLLRIGVPVIPEARVSQHKPMFLPLQADQAGGGEGREWKRQEGNGEAVTGGSIGTGRDALHCDLLFFSSPSSTTLPTPPCAPGLREGCWVNLHASTWTEVSPPKASHCPSQWEQLQRARAKENGCSPRDL